MVLHIAPELVYDQQLIQCTHCASHVHSKSPEFPGKPNRFALLMDIVGSVLSVELNTTIDSDVSMYFTGACPYLDQLEVHE